MPKGLIGLGRDLGEDRRTIAISLDAGFAFGKHLSGHEKTGKSPRQQGDLLPTGHAVGGTHEREPQETKQQMGAEDLQRGLAEQHQGPNHQRPERGLETDEQDADGRKVNQANHPQVPFVEVDFEVSKFDRTPDGVAQDEEDGDDEGGR